MAELFRPPPGYEVHRIFGTTFGLSVDALVAMFLATEGVQAEAAAADTVSKLLTATRLAGRVRVMVQDGSIAADAMRVPAALVALLDQCIVSVKVDHGTFHPKLWVIAFRRSAARSSNPVHGSVVRVVIGSRNLTLSTALEFGVVLEGTSGPPNDVSQQLSIILSECAQFDEQGLSPIISDLRAVLKTTRFSIPEEMEQAVQLIWQSDERAVAHAFPKSAKRIVVVTPFFSTTVIERLLTISSDVTLVSTPSALAMKAAMEPGTLDNPGKLHLFAVRDDVPNFDEESGEVTDDTRDFSGLHAKLLLFEHENGDSESFVGSANATVRGLGLSAHRNIECVVHARPGITIDRFRKEFLEGKKGLRPWVRPFDLADARMPTEDELLDELLTEQVRRFAALPFQLRYEQQTGTLHVRTRYSEEIVGPEGCVVECAAMPMMEEQSDEELSGPWAPLEHFAAEEGMSYKVPLSKVSAFVVVRVRHASGAARTRIAHGTLTWSGTSAEARDKAARQALLDGIDSAEILARLVLGVASRRRSPGNGGEGLAEGRESGVPRAFTYVGLEQVLQAIVRQPSLLEDLRLLVEDRSDAYFDQLIKDIRAVEASYGAV
jgi:hypothetical protein